MLDPQARAARFRAAFWVAVWVIAIFVALQTFPRDDGLRHVGHAFGEPRSWGETYSHSVFSKVADYAPWFGHDLTLRGLAKIFGLLPISRLAQQFLLAKLAALLMVCALLLLTLRRARLAEQVKDGWSLALAFVIVPIVLTQTTQRFALVRPFAFGTLFLLYGIGAAGVLRGALSTAALFFFYPYLAWIYSIPCAVAQAWRGDRRFALGALVATGVALAVQPHSLWRLLWDVLNSGSTRAVLTLQIGEFTPLVYNLAIFGFYLGTLLILARRFRIERLRPIDLLLLLFLVPSFKHMRYFLDVELPLLMVAYGNETLRALRGPFEQTVRDWGRMMGNALGRAAGGAAAPAPHAPHATVSDGESSPVRRRSLMPALLSLYLLALALLCWMNYVEHLKLRLTHEQLAPVPHDAQVLTEFNIQYEVLYARPDLRVVPSCELGFPHPSIRAPYLGFFNKGDVCALARAVGARFFIERRGMYLDPRHTHCLELVNESERLKLWRVSKGDG